ncbi:unnamed protein product [Vicia faba]|uniref:Uncharacterized protein n=1 Tax=Vicia faba TaxID=3906 RepID=A0AAV0YYB7_VICFA|nr:unnamed protein product [Vicia faba]
MKTRFKLLGTYRSRRKRPPQCNSEHQDFTRRAPSIRRMAGQKGAICGLPLHVFLSACFKFGDKAVSTYVKLANFHLKEIKFERFLLWKLMEERKTCDVIDTNKTYHEKIIQLALGVALTVYEREEEVDHKSFAPTTLTAIPESILERDETDETLTSIRDNFEVKLEQETIKWTEAESRF